jgi:cytoplasmic iron level regulating protein YaaA (DUF328/UPF0246 family)
LGFKTTRSYANVSPKKWAQSYLLENRKNLYEFGKQQLLTLNKELENDELFVNLASNRYFSAVDTG